MAIVTATKIPKKQKNIKKTKKSTKKEQKKVNEICEIEKVLNNPTEIIKGKGEYIFEEEVGEKLTIRQEKFCELYALSQDFFGNGAQAYLEVYDIDRDIPGWYKTACSGASRLLSNVKVCKKINELLTTEGFNDNFVDKQHLFLITQNVDMGVKMRAISEYNSLKARIKNKLEVEMKENNPIKERLQQLKK